VDIGGKVRRAGWLAEEVGLGSVWSTDHLIASAPILESTAVLATAVAVTERITVGYGVMLPALRPVAWAAKQVTTLQYLSGDPDRAAADVAGYAAAGVERLILAPTGPDWRRDYERAAAINAAIRRG
jgi:alkanesulfonate monooxygenase SsuD/methylene tetrahydromethanopterin reductase-like flavin-dependent oxidoreductase (luciferase family)